MGVSFLPLFLDLGGNGALFYKKIVDYIKFFKVVKWQFVANAVPSIEANISSVSECRETPSSCLSLVKIGEPEKPVIFKSISSAIVSGMGIIIRPLLIIVPSGT